MQQVAWPTLLGGNNLNHFYLKGDMNKNHQPLYSDQYHCANLVRISYYMRRKDSHKMAKLEQFCYGFFCHPLFNESIFQHLQLAPSGLNYAKRNSLSVSSFEALSRIPGLFLSKERHTQKEYFSGRTTKVRVTNKNIGESFQRPDTLAKNVTKYFFFIFFRFRTFCIFFF